MDEIKIVLQEVLDDDIVVDFVANVLMQNNDDVRAILEPHVDEIDDVLCQRIDAIRGVSSSEAQSSSPLPLKLDAPLVVESTTTSVKPQSSPPAVETNTTTTTTTTATNLQSKKNKKHKKKRKGNKKKKNKDVRELAVTKDERMQRLMDAETTEAEEFSTHSILLSRDRVPAGFTQDVVVKDVDISIDGQALLCSATLHLKNGHRYGLVGRNGCGKSTLLRRLAHRQIHNFPSHFLCCHVKQELEASDLSVVDAVIDFDTELKQLLREQDQLMNDLATAEADESVSMSEELQRISERLECIEADSAEARASRILLDMGFSKSRQKMKLSQLSGGQRMRVGLAGAVFLGPDILLLDEPARHLDLHGVLWLQRYLLEKFDGTVIVASHDVTFLNAVCTDILHVHHKQLSSYIGNYDAFVRQRDEKQAHLAATQANLDKHRAHHLQTIQRIEKAAKTKRGDQKKLGTVASRRKKVQRMGVEKTESGKKWKLSYHDDRPGSLMYTKYHGFSGLGQRPEAPIVFSLKQPLNLGVKGPLVSMEHVRFAYNKTTTNSTLLVNDLSMVVEQRARIGILGKNGTGKSTLLKLIGGVLLPTGGDVHRLNNMKVGVFSQHHVDDLDVSMTATEYLHTLAPSQTMLDLRQHCGSFGLHGDLAMKPMACLSGGQKTRAVFAGMMLKQAPHLLVLDEPANDLDIETTDILCNELKSYDGAVILVSHNQHVLKEVCNEFYVVHGKGDIVRFRGLFSDYLHTL